MPGDRRIGLHDRSAYDGDFGAGQRTKAVSVTVRGDFDLEFSATFFANFYNAAGMTMGTTSASADRQPRLNGAASRRDQGNTKGHALCAALRPWRDPGLEPGTHDFQSWPCG